ncbi:MAG: phosphoribosylformylglycinamidine cyclo-ligase [Oscillospiraceae bacterium]|nr:phosphoribosylformylglycinamidine cyclo-ligase [Oscillospiraceae bacterium]
MEKWTYEKAGVSVNAGYETVKRMKRHASRTVTAGVLDGLGSFGALFEVPPGYKKPVLVSGTDSVGTKVMIAFEMDIHNTIGIDCVAMCVNDIICMGAKPLYFLDYIGIGGLDPRKAELIVEGVSEGCLQSGAALIGGETCEMPDIYKPGEYDLVGFAVGIAEKSKIISGSGIAPTDTLIGISSSGLHSNGFTLARKLVEAKGLKYTDHIASLGKTLGEELLTPTKIYAKMLERLIASVRVKGIANITGGGWVENIPRMLPGGSDLKMRVYKDSVPDMEIFNLIQKWGNIDELEMYSTFNMGIGMVVCVDDADAGAAIAEIEKFGEKAYKIGQIHESTQGEESIVII